jgi:hypothetical protein
VHDNRLAIAVIKLEHNNEASHCHIFHVLPQFSILTGVNVMVLVHNHAFKLRQAFAVNHSLFHLVDAPLRAVLVHSEDALDACACSCRVVTLQCCHSDVDNVQLVFHIRLQEMRQCLVDVHNSAHSLDVLHYELVVGHSEAVVGLNVLKVRVLCIAPHKGKIAFPLFFLDDRVKCLRNVSFCNYGRFQISYFLDHCDKET